MVRAHQACQKGTSDGIWLNCRSYRYVPGCLNWGQKVRVATLLTYTRIMQHVAYTWLMLFHQINKKGRGLRVPSKKEETRKICQHCVACQCNASVPEIVRYIRSVAMTRYLWMMTLTRTIHLLDIWSYLSF